MLLETTAATVHLMVKRLLGAGAAAGITKMVHLVAQVVVAVAVRLTA
jgi:hypothetical protein